MLAMLLEMTCNMLTMLPRMIPRQKGHGKKTLYKRPMR